MHPLVAPLTDGVNIPFWSQAKYLGVIIDNKFSWQLHVDHHGKGQNSN
jgi:hypothetical protein